MWLRRQRLVLKLSHRLFCHVPLLVTVVLDQLSAYSDYGIPSALAGLFVISAILLLLRQRWSWPIGLVATVVGIAGFQHVDIRKRGFALVFVDPFDPVLGRGRWPHRLGDELRAG